MIPTFKKRQTETQTDRRSYNTDREADRGRQSSIYRQEGRQADIQTKRQIDREAVRQLEKQRGR